MSDEIWYRLECLVADSDGGADGLWELGAAGVEVQDRETFMEGGTIPPVPEGRTRLIAFFDLADGDPETLESTIRDVLEPDSIVLARYEDTSWQTAWRDYFHPVRLSRRVMVGPPWEEFSAPEGGHRLVIEPGLAFGTGTHETTQLVGEILDDIIADEPPATLLDVGCGSAILSMQARVLGVDRVIGIDVDETAVGIAKETVELNDLSNIELSTRPIEAFDDETFPIVLANILGHILLSIRESLVDRVAPGGHLLVSGVTREQSEVFDREFGAAPLELVSRHERGDWVAFVYRKVEG